MKLEEMQEAQNRAEELRDAFDEGTTTREELEKLLAALHAAAAWIQRLGGFEE